MAAAAYEDDNPVILFEAQGLYRVPAPRQMGARLREVWLPKKLRAGDFGDHRHLRRNGAARH